MINAGHASLEFIWDHCESVAHLDHAIHGPQERQSNQNRCKQQGARCHGKERPQQHEEPAYPKNDVSQAEPALQGGTEQRPEGVASSYQREERALEEFYQRLQPFAIPFMALFGRDRLPSRSALSRFLAALTEAPVEALRTLLTSRSARSAPHTRQANRKPVGSSRNLLDGVRHRWDARGCSAARATPDR